MKILFTCLIFSISSSFAQTVQQPQIGLGLGWSYVAVKAPTTSSLTYKRSSVPFQLFFNNDGAKNKHFVQAFYQESKLKDAVRNSLTETRGGFQYSYHRRMSVLKNGLAIYAGGIFNSQASIRQGTGVNSEDGNIFVGVDASVLAIYNKNKNKFEGQFATTLFAYTVSSEYGLTAPPDINNDSRASQALKLGKWSSFGSFYQFTLRLSYERSLSKRFSARADYRWNFYKFKTEPIFGSLCNQLITSIVYKF